MTDRTPNKFSGYGSCPAIGSENGFQCQRFARWLVTIEDTADQRNDLRKADLAGEKGLDRDLICGAENSWIGAAGDADFAG